MRFWNGTRRGFLRGTLPLLGLAPLAGRVWGEEPGKPVLAATPPCGDDPEPTESQTEGPFFKPKSPERASLVPEGFTGPTMVVSGIVFSTECKPVAGALLDFWHADENGDYDNETFTCRGHQFTDAEGRYRLETVLPGRYPGRTRHFHVKVQAPDGKPLTTQLYFPNEPQNEDDSIYDSDLLMTVEDDEDNKVGAFNFILKLA